RATPALCTASLHDALPISEKRRHHEDDMSFEPGLTNAGSPQSDLYATLEQALQPWHDEPGNLLPVLHTVQESLGYIPHDAIAWRSEEHTSELQSRENLVCR